jgi:hypothetical protein
MEPDLRRFAPIIVVASVLENEIIQKRPAARMPKVLLDLHRVKVHLETTIRLPEFGWPLKNLALPELTFYYFDQDFYSPEPNPDYKQMFQAEPGERYIVFLSVENGVLRSVGDVGEYSVRVLSGAHPDYKVPSNLGIAVADILLTKGAGFDAERFAKTLHRSKNLADRWGSRLHNIQLLRVLVTEPEPVRSAACYELVTYYNGQYDCLYRIRDDTQEPEAVREQARGLLAKQNVWDARLLEVLKDPAHLSSLPIIGTTNRRQVVLDELKSLLATPNPKVRKAACEALRRYYPHDREASCCNSPGKPASLSCGNQGEVSADGR